MPTITLTWTDAPKSKKQGRAVSRRFEATLLDGSTVSSVVEAKHEADLPAAAEADLRRFGANAEGDFSWTREQFAAMRGRAAIEARIVDLEGEIADDPVRSKAQIAALKFALGEDLTPMRIHSPGDHQAITAERYMEMLEVLPPARWAHDGFLVGEPHDHSGPEGHARYAYFYRRGDEHFEAGLLTEAQFNARHPRSK